MLAVDTKPKTYKDKVNQSIAFSGLTVDFFTQKKVKELSKYVKGKTILNVGCGVGLLDKHLAPLAKRWVGIDIDRESIKEASKNEGEYLWYDGVKIPAGKFDVILCINVLHHVESHLQQNLFREMAGHLDGVLICLEHNPWNPITRFIFKHSEIDKGCVMLSAARVRSFMDFFDLKAKTIFHAFGTQTITFGRKNDK